MRTREKIEIDLVEEFVKNIGLKKDKIFAAYAFAYCFGIVFGATSIYAFSEQPENIFLKIFLCLNILIFLLGFILIGYSKKIGDAHPVKIRLISETYLLTSIMCYMFNTIDMALICNWNNGVWLIFMQLILLVATMTMAIILTRRKYILPESRGKEKEPVWGPSIGTAAGISALFNAVVRGDAKIMIAAAAAALLMCFPLVEWMRVFYAIKYKIKLDDDVPAEDNTPTTNDQV